MRKLRVGVWLIEKYSPEEGGGFGYYNQIIDKLSSYSFKDAEITFISYNFPSNWPKKKNSYTIKTSSFKIPTYSFKDKFRNKVYSFLNIEQKKEDHSFEIKNRNDQLRNELSDIIDVIYYPIPGCYIENFPFIYTLWDIGHLSTFAFPEVSMNNTFEIRNQYHEIIPKKALLVFCESEKGKQDAIQYLHLSENRIKVIPIFPSEIVNSKIKEKKTSLTLDFFIHYPAQFWSHKNHYNLLIAFEKVIVKYPNLKLVLCGSDKGNKQYINQIIERLNINKNVILLDFIDIAELKWLYKNSFGLVMPTFLGPTNMPLLEAAELCCPVACSNLEGHIEQLGDYAYYFDPKEPQQITERIIEMIEDKKNNIIRPFHSKFKIDNTLIEIDKAFSDLKSIRFCWGKNDQIF